ncbi:hypothetical protein [Mesonia sp. K7]|uniref:hypothetical protein n=1 Tax=Mesonia sp. K7 TaxID=2218606 RepID=UPI000DAA9153|nr:hypothetical protein [Mesonia sp. K7]PZD79055.1 hypothetical protein DNG35_03340 [Mesonia sp. K7]
MKSRIYLMIAIQIVIVGIAFFFFNRLTIFKEIEASLTYQIVYIIIFSIVFVFLVPKIAKLLMLINKRKTYQLEDGESLLNEYKTYDFSTTYPEQIPLKITNQNLIVTLHRQDKVYPISALKSMKVSSFFGKPYSLNLNFGKKKLTIIAENALDIERKVRQIINQ